MAFDIELLRRDFPILEREVNRRRLVYFDSGATAQKPLQVISRTEELMREYNANIHRGVHHLSGVMTDMYEQARERVRRFIGAEHREEVIFTAGATASLNLVATSWSARFLRPGDNIIVSELEHHSNIVPWQLACMRHGAELRVLPFEDSGRLRTELLDELLDERTRLVAVTEASNTLGTCPDLDLICVRPMPWVLTYVSTAVRVLSMAVVVLQSVATTSTPSRDISSMALRVSVCCMVVVSCSTRCPHIWVVAIWSIRLPSSVRPEAIHSHELRILDAMTRRLEGIEGLRIYGTTEGKCPIVSFTVEGTHPYDVGMILDKLGIAIRTGHHCAEPVMTHYGIHGMCRASIGMYNTLEEVEALGAGVERAVMMLR